jgi:cell division protein FtsI (penicillin-binding protein 3)
VSRNAPPPTPPARGNRHRPARRFGAAPADAVPRIENVRVTAPDLDRRAAMEVKRSRLVITAAGFLALFLAVVLKLADATVIDPLKPRKPEHPIATLVTDPQKIMDADNLARRAMVTDRNGQILAVSLPTAELFADPRQVVDPASVAGRIKQIVPDLDVPTVVRRLSEESKEFVFLARRITPQQEIEINNLGIPGIDFEPTEERHYPMGRVAAQVLGGVDIDEHGIAGVEKWFDKRLMSDPDPLRLSLDVRVQAVVRDALQSAVEEFKAEGGCAVMMDANTGEVLAMVSLPDYDTNNFGGAPADARFNRAVSGAYEPGSTFKLQTAAMALDDGVIHLWDQFDTIHPIYIAHHTITDFEKAHHNYEVPEIVAYSSNLGASHIAVLVGAERQRAWLRKLHFFVRSPIQLPESASPIVQPAKVWQLATIMTVSFGNGIAVTPMQLMAGTNAIVDGGFYRPPTFLALSAGAQVPGERVMQPETSETMRKLMRLVVTAGTGEFAQVPGYLVGAKTGTSQKVGNHGYKLHSNLSSMIAAFPINSPRYLVYAMVDAPHADASTHGFTTGGWIAGPVVRTIISRVAPMLGLLPASPEELAAEQAQVAIPLRPERPSSVPVAAAKSPPPLAGGGRGEGSNPKPAAVTRKEPVPAVVHTTDHPPAPVVKAAAVGAPLLAGR